MSVELSFDPEQARLVALALAYHLGRPGAEIDPDTMQPSRRGLGMAAAIMEAQRDLPQAKVTLDGYQLRRLAEATLATISELKVLSMSQAPWSPGEAAGHNVNTDFERAAARLYPVLRADPGAAREIAGAMMQLRRRLERLPAGPLPAPATTNAPSRRWWRFWRRDRGSRKNAH